MCSGCGPMHAGAAVGLCPDGIGGIFTAASGAVPWGRDALALGRKRGLMRLVLRHGATCMPGYFVGTLQLYTISHDRFGILAALSRRLRLARSSSSILDVTPSAAALCRPHTEFHPQRRPTPSQSYIRRVAWARHRELPWPFGSKLCREASLLALCIQFETTRIQFSAPVCHRYINVHS